MKDKYFLLSNFEREIGIPMLFDSLEKARDTMKALLISAMDGLDESIFDEYKEDDEYGWGADKNSAWLTHRHGNHDWKIVTYEEMESYTARIKEGMAKSKKLRLEPVYHLLRSKEIKAKLINWSVFSILRSQFFHSLRKCSSQAKVLSTIQRIGITANL